MPQASADDYLRAAAALGEASELASGFGVRLALEFQKTSPFCACLETALALVEQSGSSGAGVCLDAFHFYTGPSKIEDLQLLTAQNLAWVQVADLIGTPREWPATATAFCRARETFRSAVLVEHLGRIGYDGHVSLEVLNPHLWQVDADRLANLGHQALLRVLAPGNETCGMERRVLGVSTVATLQPAAVVYREEQYFDWRIYSFIAVGGH